MVVTSRSPGLIALQRRVTDPTGSLKLESIRPGDAPPTPQQIVERARFKPAATSDVLVIDPVTKKPIIFSSKGELFFKTIQGKKVSAEPEVIRAGRAIAPTPPKPEEAKLPERFTATERTVVQTTTGVRTLRTGQSILRSELRGSRLGEPTTLFGPRGKRRTVQFGTIDDKPVKQTVRGSVVETTFFRARQPDLVQRIDLEAIKAPRVEEPIDVGATRERIIRQGEGLFAEITPEGLQKEVFVREEGRFVRTGQELELESLKAIREARPPTPTERFQPKKEPRAPSRIKTEFKRVEEKLAKVTTKPLFKGLEKVGVTKERAEEIGLKIFKEQTAIKPFVGLPKIRLELADVTRRIPFRRAGERIPPEEIVRAQEEFVKGTVGGAFVAVRERPLKSALVAATFFTLPVAGTGVAAGAFALVTKAPTAAKILGIAAKGAKLVGPTVKAAKLGAKIAGPVLGSAFVGQVAREIKAAPTPRAKGEVLGEVLATELAPALVGGFLGTKVSAALDLRLGLTRQIAELPKAKQKEFKELFEFAKSLRKVQPKVKEISLRGFGRIPPKARPPILKVLKKGKGDIIVGGSVAQRTQIFGREAARRSFKTSDIDLFITGKITPIQRAKQFEAALKAAGVQRVSRVPKKARITIKGQKVIEIFPAGKILQNIRQVELFGPTVVKTPSGIQVQRIGLQAQRKLIGGFTEPKKRFKSDIEDFRLIIKSLFRTTELQAKQALFFRKTRIRTIEEARLRFDLGLPKQKAIRLPEIPKIGKRAEIGVPRRFPSGKKIPTTLRQKLFTELSKLKLDKRGEIGISKKFPSGKKIPERLQERFIDQLAIQRKIDVPKKFTSGKKIPLQLREKFLKELTKLKIGKRAEVGVVRKVTKPRPPTRKVRVKREREDVLPLVRVRETEFKIPSELEKPKDLLRSFELRTLKGEPPSIKSRRRGELPSISKPFKLTRREVPSILPTKLKPSKPPKLVPSKPPKIFPSKPPRAVPSRAPVLSIPSQPPLIPPSRPPTVIPSQPPLIPPSKPPKLPVSKTPKLKPSKPPVIALPSQPPFIPTPPTIPPFIPSFKFPTDIGRKKKKRKGKRRFIVFPTLLEREFLGVTRTLPDRKRLFSGAELTRIAKPRKRRGLL